jgi:hypothetical protein
VNQIDSLIARVEDYRSTNKNPCKSYKTKAAAEKATAEVAQLAANHFAVLRNINAVPARYMVVYVPAWGRYIGAIDLTELLARPSSTGGYLGVCSARGFFSY